MTKHTAKKIVAGLYEYRGFRIAEDNFGYGKVWTIDADDGSRTLDAAETLTSAKAVVDAHLAQ